MSQSTNLYYIWIMYTIEDVCHVGVESCLRSINIHSTYSRVLQSPVTHQQVTMGTSYSSQQLGIFNMNISHLNMPSMILGICKVIKYAKYGRKLLVQVYLEFIFCRIGVGALTRMRAAVRPRRTESAIRRGSRMWRRR